MPSQAVPRPRDPVMGQAMGSWARKGRIEWSAVGRVISLGANSLLAAGFMCTTIENGWCCGGRVQACDGTLRGGFLSRNVPHLAIDYTTREYARMEPRMSTSIRLSLKFTE